VARGWRIFGGVIIMTCDDWRIKRLAWLWNDLPDGNSNLEIGG
jgi:hypothetical protein